MWDGPIAIDEALGCKGDKDYGLYAIYGTHASSGSDSLLYVGQANANSFGGRLKQHYDDWIAWEPSDVRVCLGRVGGFTPVTEEQWGDLINNAEALTIFYTSPPYNCHHIKKLSIRTPTLGATSSAPVSSTRLYF